MKYFLSWVLMMVVGFSLTGCSSVAGKAVTHKAKNISPVHDSKTEKVAKKVDKIGVKDNDEGGILKSVK